jgi:glucosamine--fructose-6-phosphate aminotransferase (isomerizing)
MSFLEEVAEQSRRLHKLVNFYRTEEGIELLWKATHLFTHHTHSIIFAGMGTSEYVPLVVRDYLTDKLGVPVVLWESGELLHYGMDGIRDDDLIIALSQSGESIETRRVVDALRDHLGVISVTNDPESTIARHSSLDLQIFAGAEASISSKTYTNSMGLLHIMSRAAAALDAEPLYNSLLEIADSMESFRADRLDEIEYAAEFMHQADAVHFISRGPSMAAARQAALTFGEGAHLFTCAVPGGSVRHGLTECMGEGHYGVIFAPDGPGGDLLRKLALDLAVLGSKIILFTSQETPKDHNLHAIRITPGDPELFPLACAMPQELLFETLSRDKGLVAGVFIHGEKVTTKE